MTLTTGTLHDRPQRHPDRHRQLRGRRVTDAQPVTLTSAGRASARSSASGTVDAYGGMDLGPDVVIQGTTLNNHGAATWDRVGGGTTRSLAEQ